MYFESPEFDFQRPVLRIDQDLDLTGKLALLKTWVARRRYGRNWMMILFFMIIRVV